MAETLSVNRYLKDKSMDRIDHALGRPVDPLVESYRNYYAIDRKCDLAAAMRVDPLWQECGRMDDMAYFHVTQAGRNALRSHLRSIGDRHKIFTIQFDGIVSSVVAETRSKARYSKWLDISDARPDLCFRDFLVGARVEVDHG